MKIVKKLVTYFCLIFLLASTLTSQAAENGDIIDGSILTNLSEVSGTTQSKGRGTYLAYGSAKLTNQGNHVLYVWGSTTCYQTSNQVKVTLHLQRLVNGVWSNVTTLDTKVAYNTNYVSNSKSVTVTGGYYYRISGSHTAIKGKTVETTSSVTDGMWVSK